MSDHFSAPKGFTRSMPGAGLLIKVCKNTKPRFCRYCICARPVKVRRLNALLGCIWAPLWLSPNLICEQGSLSPFQRCVCFDLGIPFSSVLWSRERILTRVQTWSRVCRSSGGGGEGSLARFYTLSNWVGKEEREIGSEMTREFGVVLWIAAMLGGFKTKKYFKQRSWLQIRRAKK